MNAYQHTQRGKLILAAMLIATLVTLAIGLVSRPALLAAPILALCGWLFHSLTIEVTDGELRWRFGPGLIRKRVALDMIVSVQSVRTNVLEGWGIHLSRFGWLYNVSGFDAVAIKMKNGQHFALGTDEPEALCRALQAAATGPKPPEPAVRC
jgi:hypothetical protein